jgi:hypothetical protein
MTSRIVQCDGCGAVVDSDQKMGNPRAMARAAGWLVPEDDHDWQGKDYCPACAQTIPKTDRRR